ncbi:MAG: zinc-binding dehydrogenase [Burkholderiaceae bacterium]
MSTNANIVVQFEKDGELRFAEIRLGDPGPHQVIVKMLATGLCQSQIYWMHRERTDPVLFGHEGYGVATGVGSDVSGIREGDPVLVTWIPRRDPSGRQAQVATAEVSPGVIGRSPNVYTWADHCMVDELYVRPIRGPAHDPLMSIIGCAVITGAGAVLNAAETRKGESVAVFGVGGVGLSAVAAARVAGAERIVAVDLDDDKLALARRFGATDGINSRHGDPAGAILRLGPVRCGCHPGVDVAIDCVAIPEVTLQALASLRQGRLGIERGGRCMVVGIPKQPFAVDTADLMMKEKSLVGVLGGSAPQERIDDFIDWYRDGVLDLEALVTDRFRFDQIPAAADALARGQIVGRAIAIF